MLTLIKLFCVICLFEIVIAGNGWTKYLSDAQNTGSTNLSGPTDDLCQQFVVTNNFSTPLLTPPIVSPDNNLYIASSNISVTTLQKTSINGTPTSIWTAQVPFEFRTHTLLDPSGNTWAGSNNCTIVVIRDQGSSFSKDSLQLSNTCTLPLTGGLSQSSDGSILITRAIDGLYFAIDMKNFPLNSTNILWSKKNDVVNETNDFGTLLIDPKNGNMAWGLSNGVLFSVNLLNGTFTQENLDINLKNDIVVSSLVSDPNSGRTYFTTASNQVYCFILSTGELVWQSSYQNETFYHRPSTPALSFNNNVLYIVISYAFCAFDSTNGHIDYTVSLQEERNMPLYVSVDKNDRVYFTSETHLYGIDGSTGKVLYNNDTLGLVYLDSAVTIVGNSALALQSGSQFMILTDQANNCTTDANDSDTDTSDIYIWIVTSILSFFIVAFGILLVADLVRRMRKSSYEELDK